MPQRCAECVSEAARVRTVIKQLQRQTGCLLAGARRGRRHPSVSGRRGEMLICLRRFLSALCQCKVGRCTVADEVQLPFKTQP